MKVNFSNCCKSASALGAVAPSGSSSVFVVTADNVAGGSNVGLSGIARKMGWSAPEALGDSERVHADAIGWAGALGAAKLIALANGIGWNGPPSWGTTPLYVGQKLAIPAALAGTGSGGRGGISTFLKVAAGIGALGLGIAVFGKEK